MSKSQISAIKIVVPDPEHRFEWIPPDVRHVDGPNWKLLHDVSYRTEAGEKSTARKGFVFDWASIPRPLSWIYPPAGDGSNHYGIAAIFHDWLYAHRKIGGRPVTRREADVIFYEILIYVGCRRSLAYAMWKAVRTFGWIPWMRRKERDIIK